MFKKGFFPIHNRFLISVDFLLDFYNTLTVGSSSIETIKKKLELLGLCEDISEHVEKNLVNHASDIEMACIAVISLLITPQDMDDVTCLVCGACPKIVNSDGNAKDTIKVTDNMVFEYEDDSPVPDLHSFKMDLIQTTLKKSYFQNEPAKKYNMLKLPLIIPPILMGQQMNTDINNKTLLERKFSFTKATMAELAKMIDAQELNILGINDLSSDQLVEVATRLKLEKPKKKSGTNLKNELNYLVRRFLAGEVTEIYLLKRNGEII